MDGALVPVESDVPVDGVSDCGVDVDAGAAAVVVVSGARSAVREARSVSARRSASAFAARSAAFFSASALRTASARSFLACPDAFLAAWSCSARSCSCWAWSS